MDEALSRFIRDSPIDQSLYNAGMFFVDYDRDYGHISMVCRQLGFAKEEMTSGAYQAKIHPEDLEVYLQLWNRFTRGYNDELYCEYRLKNGDGDWSWIQTQAFVLKRYGNGEIAKLLGFDRLINSRKNAEEILRQQLLEAERKSEIAETVLSAGRLMITDAHLSDNLYEGLEKLRDIISFSHCVLILSEEGRGEMICYPREGQYILPPLSALVDRMARSIYPVIEENSPGEGGSLMAVPLRTEEKYAGTLILFNNRRGVFSGMDMFPVRSFAHILTIAILNHYSMKNLVRDLERDELTGFLTRKSFDLTLEGKWPEMTTGEKGNFSFCMLDLDYFKRVNDNFGHQVGDIVLGKIARICRRMLRDGDILGRYGGEEFLIVLRSVGAEGAGAIMERLRASIENRRISQIGGNVTVSIGISSYGRYDTILAMTKRADDALYKAKRRGRNRVVSLP